MHMRKGIQSVKAMITAGLMATALLSGCGNSAQSEKPSESPPATIQPTPESSPSENPSASAEGPASTLNPNTPPQTGDKAILEQIAAMTLEQKVGQLAIIGLEGKSMDKSTESFIQNYHVGGFILFKDNITSANQTLKLLNQLKAANEAVPDSVPLWLSVDQEGGKVNRLPSEFDKTPTARQIASKQNPKYTEAIGSSLGLKIGSLGFNMDFAPVLDINSNPDNPVIGDRSFGSDAESVSLHGLAMMEGITSQGVAAVAKHFPGHGDTSVDSHKGLPVVNKSLNELKNFELLPFEEAIKKDVDAIMVGHLLMKKLDAENPASISPAVITGLLREQLGYDGVIITDDMTMKGLTGGISVGKAAVEAILAGGDILLVCHEYKLQQEALDAVMESVKDGVISQERLDESVYRVLSLKAKYELSDAAMPAVDTSAINAAVEDSLKAFQAQ